VYDEEVLAGWSAAHVDDGSQLNTECVWCGQLFVPKLTVTCRRYVCEGACDPDSIVPWDVRDSWYKPTKRVAVAKRSVVKQEEQQQPTAAHSSEYLCTGATTCEQHTTTCHRRASSYTPLLTPTTLAANTGNEPERPTTTANDPSQLSLEFEVSETHALLSPAVLRKEIETVLTDDEKCMSKVVFIEKHPILFWNMVYYMRRVCLPTHFVQWLASTTDPCVCALFASTVSTNESRVFVRCVYDFAPLHADECLPPMYAQYTE
jgi:hypothetical protein